MHNVTSLYILKTDITKGLQEGLAATMARGCLPAAAWFGNRWYTTNQGVPPIGVSYQSRLSSVLPMVQRPWSRKNGSRSRNERGEILRDTHPSPIAKSITTKRGPCDAGPNPKGVAFRSCERAKRGQKEGDHRASLGSPSRHSLTMMYQNIPKLQIYRILDVIHH